MHPIEQKLQLITNNLRRDSVQELVIRNYLKEYLQDIFLYVIYNHPRLKELIFYGGSCLRKVYGLNRVSEDLDFESLEEPDLGFIKETFLNYFNRQRFDSPTANIQASGNINRVTVKFPILHQLGLSPYPGEKLHIKIEIRRINKRYPVELTPYTKDRYSMLLRHYDLPTLMAGKIAACLTRVFEKGHTGIEIKGRDFYDLVWYLQKKVEPNMDLLQDLDIGKNKNQVFEKLDNKVKKIKPRDLFIDLEPLFKDRTFIRDWCQNFHQIYKSARDIAN